MRDVTAEEIESARLPSGGWSKETLAQWGVSWPPPKGWKRKLLNKNKTNNHRSNPWTRPLSVQDRRELEKYLPRLIELHREAVAREYYWAKCYEIEIDMINLALKTGGL